MPTPKLQRRALLLCALLAANGVFGQTDTAPALLDLLVKKGLVTPQEAAQLEQQAQANAAAAAGAPAPAAVPEPPAPKGGVGVPPTVDVAASPLAFRIGAANFTPFGFMDFTGVYRSTTVGSGIGTGFGSIPYSNTNGSTIGALSETRFSTQNSRLGLRVDSNVGDTQVLGYTEADFLGNAANNVATVSNADTLRLRVYFVDARLKSGWEFLAGQDWSLLTPNRKGLSPLPSDIFFTQDVDTNYQVGLVWTRQTQVRAVYHASDAWTFGVSLENPDQYVGSAAVLPTTDFNANQVDISAGSNSSGTTNANTMPDVIAKAAYDVPLAGGMALHADAAGFLREFKINTFGSGGALNADDSRTGYGGSFNLNLSVLPHLSLIENAFASEGGGRYVSTGLGPDFVVEPADASGVYRIALEEADAGMLGFEWAAAPQDSVYGYWGIAHFGQKYYQTSTGAFLGYGYAGSSNSDNRSIEEYTLGDAYTIWKNPAYGALQAMLQLSYLDRKPWYVAPGSPSDAHLGMFYFDLRYTLP